MRRHPEHFLQAQGNAGKIPVIVDGNPPPQRGFEMRGRQPFQISGLRPCQPRGQGLSDVQCAQLRLGFQAAKMR